ncbi:MAG: ATP-binding cassette domain-containing protein [Candidatus Caenarcaniphilales bacterium]|nr:ATP-binding cassette domain-containing protein [Candidatus Caenarcaniphilales bacterium]
MLKKPAIQISKLSKRYGDKPVLHNISFEVYRGETVAVIGPSGIGKSTILKILSGLEEDYEGSFKLSSDKLAMVFQYSALLNSYSVKENVIFALHDSNLSEKEQETRALKKLAEVGLEDYADAMPDELSGGQQKRVSFARAIVTEPDIVLYDEPTAGLDPISSTVVEDYICRMSRRDCTAGIVVTHQHSTIRRTAHRVICLFRGEIAWQGTIAEMDQSDNPYIRQFIDGRTEGPFTD